MSDNSRKGQDEASHQCTESTEPQNPRNAIPAIVRRFFVLVTSIDKLEDETGSERNLPSAR